MSVQTASIIAIGSEMLGTTRVDTNSLKITTALENAGIPLIRKSVVGDTLDDLVDEIRFAVRESDILITSGGLGPTEDDLTREALAKAFGLEMDVDQSIIDKIAARFAARGWRMPEVNKRQANVFRGQKVLYNERGTAPGFHLIIPALWSTDSQSVSESGTKDRLRAGAPDVIPKPWSTDSQSVSESPGAPVEAKHVWVFPGVPHELEWMVTTYFAPWLAGIAGDRARHRRVLKIAGMTESGVEERLKPFYASHPREPVTILASPAGIEVHLITDAAAEGADSFIASREAELHEIFGGHVFGYDDDTLESVIGRMLIDRRETVATAESCTGGLLSSRITDVSGSSAYFLGGAVCYTAAAKTDLAGVDAELIRAHGEVSEPVAIALARGIRERFGSTYGIGVTGIAGPTGGTPEKPVGTVHIAVASAAAVEHRKLQWQGPRTIIKWYSTQQALDMLRRFLPDVR
jgi:nicotinamide-nucleotide amidase